MNKKLLKTEAQRFKQIYEYNFYIPRDNDLNEDDEVEDEEGFPEPDMGDDDAAMDAETPGMGGEEAPAPEGEPGMEAPEGEPGMEEPEMDGEELPEPEGEINAPDVEGPEPEAEADGDEIELDVTDIVKKSEDAKVASDEANMKIDQLMAKLGELESKLPNMEMFGQKLDNLESEIEKRNPTDNEKLEMRSMDSFPYNLKLTDYWNDEDDSDYEVNNGEGQTFEKEEELTLTKDEVDSTYSDNKIKDTFDYEEEDI